MEQIDNIISCLYICALSFDIIRSYSIKTYNILIQLVIRCHFFKKSAKNTLSVSEAPGSGATTGTGGQHYTNMLLVHHQQMQVVSKDNGNKQ
jgi:hypothetical protein